MNSPLGGGGIFSEGKTAQADWKPTITEESMLTAARTNSDEGVTAPGGQDCPQVQVEGGQRHVTIYESNRIGDGSAVVHRGEITKTARECRAGYSDVTVKYGVAGRVLLGPRGKPGTITLPATVLVQDKTKAKIKSEQLLVTVNISRQNPLAYFSIVKDITIPMKPETKPQDYALVIAFDKNRPGMN